MAHTEKADKLYLAKARRRRGLQQTHFYCQLCRRQCLDQHGFALHAKSQSHMRNLEDKLAQHGGDAEKLLRTFSDEFERAFLLKLKSAHGEKLVGLNSCYQEYITDKDAVHLNATRWTSLTRFAIHLRDSGKCRLENVDNGSGEKWLIGYKREPTRREGEKQDLEKQELLEYIDEIVLDEDKVQDKITQDIPTGKVATLEPAPHDQLKDASRAQPLSAPRKKVAFKLKKK